MRNIGIILIALSFACSPKKTNSQTTSSEPLESDGMNVSDQISNETTSEIVLKEPQQIATWKEAEVQKTDLKGFHTQFVNKGRGLLYSKENYEGLWYYDLKSKSGILITDKSGAGYQPQWLNGKIVYQVKGRMKHIESFDFSKKMVESIDESEKSLSPARYAIENNDQAYAGLTKDLLGIELVLASGEKKVIQPQTDGNYISASLSPNGQMLLYEVAGLGGFVAELSGKTIVKLGNVDAPKWISDDQVVFAKSTDDGMQILGSEVFVFDLASRNEQPLVIDDVDLFEPSVNDDGTQISAHSSEGNIYIFNQK